MTSVSSYIDAYREHGFAVVRAVFGPADVAELSRAFDDMKAAGSKHRASFRHGNVLYVVGSDPVLGPVLRLMQWPSYRNPVMARYRNDTRLLQFLEPLIGRDLKQLTNSLIWKQPGAAEGSFAYHQDCRFRRPASAFRNIETSIVQTAIALDPHCVENGCMRMLRGSHRRGDLRLAATASVYEAPCDEVSCNGSGSTRQTSDVLDPGDLVLWHPYTVHGSHPNRSTADRRSYINAYVVARDCDRGEWASVPTAVRSATRCWSSTRTPSSGPNRTTSTAPHPFEPD
jgi:ectoine hydroxylase-related dioxygenase (phytanoyl-CoA dioxygenase family)